MLSADLKKWSFVRGVVSTFISNHVYGVDAKPLYSGFFSSFPLTQVHKLHICALEDKHMLTLTIHSVKCCVLYIKFWILKPRKYWLESSTYYFIKHARPLHGFRCGCGYLQMTHHCWSGSPGMQGWTVQGEQEVLPCTRTPSSGSHHTLKTPASKHFLSS